MPALTLRLRVQCEVMAVDPDPQRCALPCYMRRKRPKRKSDGGVVLSSIRCDKYARSGNRTRIRAGASWRDSPLSAIMRLMCPVCRRSPLCVLCELLDVSDIVSYTNAIFYDPWYQMYWASTCDGDSVPLTEASARSIFETVPTRMFETDECLKLNPKWTFNQMRLKACEVVEEALESM